MKLRLQIPTYHSKDFLVMSVSMMAMALIVNQILFAPYYFASAAVFVPTTLVSFAFFCMGFITYGSVALALRERFPAHHAVMKRLAISLGIFYLLSALYVSALLLGYDLLHFAGYQYSENDFVRSWACVISFNTFLTFLNEGIYSYDRFKHTVTETEQLKKEYLRSQVLGLRSQMNPHFLFNSLNTLSCLIHEDEKKAEDFLDHMSKVYRYLLRDGEELVPVSVELDFIRSYFYLMQSRFGDGLQLLSAISNEAREMQIPPLTLQMIVESTVQNHEASRKLPLRIQVTSEGSWLQVRHNKQEKASPEAGDEIWCNIANKCRLLTQKEVNIYENESEKIIHIPLINPTRAAAYEV